MQRLALKLLRLLVADWHTKLTSLLIAIIFWQFFEFVADYWFDETIEISKYTLYSLVLIQGFLLYKYAIRHLVQLIALVGIVAYVLDYRFADVKVSSLASFWQWLEHHASPFSPYIWFGIAIWLAFALVQSFVVSKKRIIVFVVLTVIVLSGIDSFSQYMLWDNIAWIIFSGLSMLVVNHFYTFKQKNPDGWTIFSEYPAAALFMIVIIVSIIMAAGIVAPNINPILPDPYTAWQKLQGKEVPIIGDPKVSGETAFLSSTGNASSGYSREDKALGGGFDYDYSPVMTVTTSRRSYWRGESKAVYTGAGWTDMNDRGEMRPESSSNPLPKGELFDTSKLQSQEIRQMVTMLNEQKYPVLFGAYSIDRFESINDKPVDAFNTLTWYPESLEMHWNEQLKTAYPKQYVVISQAPVIDVSGLRQAQSPSPADSYTGLYLQLPDTVPDRVRQLAADIVQGATNPYDQMKKIEDYLEMHYEYNNKPDVSLGKSKDFVDRFLFEIKEGYCDYFSTTMVVMARSLGIPARWVKGYAPGQSPRDIAEMQRNDPFREIDPDAGGTYTVRNADAHSWAEIYFEGYGWIPFEPTPGFSMPALQPEKEQTQPDSNALPESATSEEENTSDSNGIAVWGGIAGGAAVLAAIAAALLIWRKKLLLVLFRRSPVQGLSANHKIVAEFEKLLRFFRRKGFTRAEHETVRETVKRWTVNNRPLKHDLDVLLHIFEKAKYGRSFVTEDELRTALGKVRKIREEL